MFYKLFISLLLISGCNAKTKVASSEAISPTTEKTMLIEELDGYSKAYFAAGCFWCVEAIFESVKGVAEVISGYSGGSAEDADYRKVSAGVTQHAEAVEIYYDPAVISYETLLSVLFDSHDPTTLNRQGPDSGYQYRSAVFYRSEAEKEITLKYIAELTAKKTFKNPIVTQVVAFDAFYPAEDYHQNYEKLNPDNSYVKNVSIPRLQKFQAKRPELLK